VPRIAVVTSSPPFSEGGHLVIAHSLVQALRGEGHDADLIITPQNRFGRQAAAYRATWLTDVGVTGDDRPIHQVISLRYPSYAVRHPAHVSWLNHTMREYYDQWRRFSAPLSWRGRIKERVRRRLIRTADRYLLRRVRRLYVQSRTIGKRLEDALGLRSEVLYPPAPQRDYRLDEYGDYLFAVSRLTTLKRIDLLIEALAEPEARDVKCVIAGDGEERRPLEHLVAERRMGDRVRLVGRIDDRELVNHLACCRAVCFPPFDEDYGLVTMEAFSSSKAVITCRDSGGVSELVVDGESGLVVEPSPADLAQAIRRVFDDPALAKNLGSGAARRAAAVNWRDTVRKLVVV
jgi:glycosyltransferase involved in cell wall biosynthesis